MQIYLSLPTTRCICPCCRPLQDAVCRVPAWGTVLLATFHSRVDAFNSYLRTLLPAQLVYLGVSLAGSALLMRWVLGSLDPEKGNKKRVWDSSWPNLVWPPGEHASVAGHEIRGRYIGCYIFSTPCNLCVASPLRRQRL